MNNPLNTYLVNIVLLPTVLLCGAACNSAGDNALTQDPSDNYLDASPNLPSVLDMASNTMLAEIGAACDGPEECESNNCLMNASFPDHYCTQDCTQEPTCPNEATCHSYLGSKLCFRQCNGDSECRQGYVCDYNVCRPPCQNNEACQSPHLCFNGRCKAKCENEKDCDDKELCIEGKCQTVCKADGDCAKGQKCNLTTGFCLKALGEACLKNDECATAYCLPTRRICSTTCTSSTNCPANYICSYEKRANTPAGEFGGVEADCVPVKGPSRAGTTCNDNAKCASNLCYYGFCMEGCAKDIDCGTLQCVDINLFFEKGTAQYKGCLPRQGVAFSSFGAMDTKHLYHIDIPSNASSFVLMTEAPSAQDRTLVVHLAAPSEKILYEHTEDSCKKISQLNQYSPEDEQFASIYVPNYSPIELETGLYAIALNSTKPEAIFTPQIVLKLGKAEKGTLNINWFFSDLAGSCIPGSTLNAASAASHTWFNKFKTDLGNIFATAKLTIGTETYQNVTDTDLSIIHLDETPSSTNELTDLQRLFSSSAGKQGYALNIFLVRSLETESPSSGTILGVSGGIPGPIKIHGTVHSGVAFSAQNACLESNGINSARTLAHEIGHYLGLFHNRERSTFPGFANDKVVCACPCGIHLSCYSDYVTGKSWCRGEDPLSDTDLSTNNLMYWNAYDQTSRLTDEQIRIILNNPLVGF